MDEIGTDVNPAFVEDVMNPSFVMEKGERLKMTYLSFDKAVLKLILFSCS